MNLSETIRHFMDTMGRDGEAIYNEFTLQFELGWHLRQCLGDHYEVRVERNIKPLLAGGTCLKSRADIVIFGPAGERHCIELKYPSNGQYPEQMYKACQDLRFLEQLRQAGFVTCHFLMMADDHLYWEGPSTGGIYAHFRRAIPVCGRIEQPTAAGSGHLDLDETYRIQWELVAGSPSRRYCLIFVG